MMKIITGFMIAIMSVGSSMAAAQAQGHSTCALAQQSQVSYGQEEGQAPLIEAHFSSDALSFFRQQYYVSGYLSSVLKQFCSWGEPLSSQLAFIFSRAIFQTKGTVQASGLDILVKMDEQLSPYTFEPRVVTVWIQGVEQQIAMPSIR